MKWHERAKSVLGKRLYVNSGRSRVTMSDYDRASLDMMLIQNREMANALKKIACLDPNEIQEDHGCFSLMEARKVLFKNDICE